MAVATVVPFTALIGSPAPMAERSGGGDSTGRQRSPRSCRQVDDHIGYLENLLLNEALSVDPRDITANDTLLRKVKSELPDYAAHISVFSLD
jgi:hypothetical protein